MNPLNCTEFEDAFERYVDGAVDEVERARLVQHAETCSGCHAQLEWLDLACSGLEALGDRWVSEASEIDLVDAVLAEAARCAKPKPNVVPFGPPQTRRPAARLRWVAVAAAAAVIVAGVALFRDGGLLQSPSTEVAQEPALTYPAPSAGNAPGMRPRLDNLAVREPLEEVTAPEQAVPRMEIARKPSETTGGPTPEGILDAYLASLNSEPGLARLREWATIHEEDARAILALEDAPSEALVGAASALSDAEAASALLTVVGRLPEEPLARFQLARAYGADPATRAEAMEQLDILEGLDPDNALTHYLKAQQYLREEPPDLDSAMEALSQGKELDRASPYSLDMAASREQALIQNGTDPDIARLLSALTAGRREAGDLTSLASELMEYGRQYEEAGDTITAMAIYEAVLELGGQVDNGLTQEQMAAADIQRQAIDALRLLGDAGKPELVEEATLDLVGSYEQLQAYFEELRSLFEGQPDFADLVIIARIIMEGGDLDILDGFSF